MECGICGDEKDDYWMCPSCRNLVCSDCAKGLNKCPWCRTHFDNPQLEAQHDDSSFGSLFDDEPFDQRPYGSNPPPVPPYGENNPLYDAIISGSIDQVHAALPLVTANPALDLSIENVLFLLEHEASIAKRPDMAEVIAAHPAFKKSNKSRSVLFALRDRVFVISDYLINQVLEASRRRAP
jgi:hypothetical protein